MITISPSELAKENVVDTVKMLQENDILFVALKKRGPKQGGMKQYNKPFAVLIQWPLALKVFRALKALWLASETDEQPQDLE